jgi:hypothetical protein
MLCRVIWSTDTDVQKDSSFFKIYGQPVQENFSGVAGNVGKDEPVDNE